VSSSHSILISVHSKHVTDMLSGRKTVELRRRALRVLPGTRVWIYCTHPTAQVEVVATIEDVVTAPPSEIWELHGPSTGLLRDEFDSYFERVQIACALVLSSVRRLKTPIGLDSLRKVAKRFHPPQFFKKLGPSCPELVLLNKAHRTLDAAPRRQPLLS
jgi:predicted transcriptional regulator